MPAKQTLQTACRMLSRLLIGIMVASSGISAIHAQVVSSTLTPLTPVPILMNTAEVQQSKVWTYAGKHWCVLGTSAGSNIMRLDGTTWTNAFLLASGNSIKADIKAVGNVVHILLYKGTTCVLYSVEYVDATSTYRFWTPRKTRVDFTMEASTQTATIDIDATGRMWMVSDGLKDVNVRWSDSPYSVWSAPIKLETNTNTGDLSAVVALPGKIGVFWSNKLTKRFAFKTHINGDDPSIWSEDEAPASQSALNIGTGFAENQFNLKVATSGRLYVSVKTGYNSASNTQVALLVRQTSGVWDDAYPVTVGTGLRPMVMLNETLNVLKVAYTLNGSIAYKQSPLYPISFGNEATLVSGAYDNVTSAKSPYNASAVVLASTATSAAGVLVEDNFVIIDNTPPTVESINRLTPSGQTTSATNVTYRAVFSEKVTGVNAADFSLSAISGTVDGTLATNAVTPVGTAGTTYDIDVTSITGAGTLRLDLKSSGTGIADVAGNNITDGFTTGQTYIITHPVPTLTSVTIASDNANPAIAKTGDVVTLSFTASRAINQPVVTIAGHSVTAVSQGGDSYQATRTLASGDDEGQVPFSIDFTATDGTDGVTVSATTNNSKVIFDRTAPDAQTINRQVPLTQAITLSAVTYRVVFSEKVTGVSADDFSVSIVSGTATANIASDAVSAVGTSGTTYDVDVTSINGAGTFQIDLNASGTSIADIAGNNISGGFTTGQTYIVSQPAPVLNTVTIASNNANSALAKVGDVVTLSFTASAPIQTPDVTIAGHAVTSTAQGGNSYEAAYTLNVSDAEGQLPFTIDFTGTNGTAGATVSATTNNSKVIFDRTAPDAQTINRQVPLTQAITLSAVTYRVVFSEKVTGVSADDFSVSVVSGSITATIASDAVSAVGTSGTTYDVDVTSINGTGTFGIDLNASGTSIADVAGNNISGGFTTAQTYIVSHPAPVLNTVTIASNNANTTLAKVGDVVTLSFTASAAIQPPVVTVAGHAVTSTAQGGNSYEATYTLNVSDAEGQLPFTIDFTGKNGTAGSTVSATTNSSKVTFDRTEPTAQSISRQSPSGQSTTATTVTYRAVFSEKVTGVNAADFTLTIVNGAVTGVLAANAVTPVGSAGTTYDVAVTSIAGNGTLRLDVKSTGTGILDQAGNELDDAFNTGETYIKTTPALTDGFASFTPLTPLPVNTETKDKPQSKVWKYANKWWTVLSISGGTKVYRLDGVTWTPVLTLATTSAKSDIKTVGNVAHVLMYKGDGSTSLLYSIEYVPSNNTYKLWTVRPARTPIDFPPGTETANMVIDGTGRMWATTTGTTEVYVYYSDYPYASWSDKITIGTGIKDDDISVITVLPNESKISVLWSNQTTKRFNFRTHADGTDPTAWSTLETPASQSAIDNIGGGMADDHLNAKVSSNGTFYCATKTSYNKNGYAKVSLLVRRPNGVWDNLYTITTNPDGTQPAVIINETKGTLKVVYCSLENGGNIIYRESALNTIAFGPIRTLISNPGTLYDYVSSASENYTSDIVIIATNLSTNPKSVVGVLATDDESGSSVVLDTTAGVMIQPAEIQSAEAEPETRPAQLTLTQKASVYPNPFTNTTTLNFTLRESARYTVMLYDQTGLLLGVIKQGYGDSGIPNSVRINEAGLAAGVYFLRVQTQKNSQTFKVLKK